MDGLWNARTRAGLPCSLWHRSPCELAAGQLDPGGGHAKRDPYSLHYMTEPKAVRVVVVTNPQGLHARPADMFVKVAIRYNAKIEVIKDGERVDGKSILSILTLAATEGTLLQLEATGPDAEAALKALEELVQTNFAEHGTVD